MATSTPLVFHERFGDVTRAQLAAYRKFNVSQSDHDELVSVYGEDNHDEITRIVKRFSETNGIFQSYRWREALRDAFTAL